MRAETGKEGVARRRGPSFNFLLAAAWAANLRLRARFDRKEGRKEGGREEERSRERNDWEAEGSHGYKGGNKFLSLWFACNEFPIRSDALWCLAPITAWLTHDRAPAYLFEFFYIVSDSLSIVSLLPRFRKRADYRNESPGRLNANYILLIFEDLQFQRKSRRSSSPHRFISWIHIGRSSRLQGYAIFWHTKREGAGTLARVRECVGAWKSVTGLQGAAAERSIGAAGPRSRGADKWTE